MSVGLHSSPEALEQNPFLCLFQCLEAIWVPWHMAVPPSSKSAILHLSDNFSMIISSFHFCYKDLCNDNGSTQITQDKGFNLTLYAKALLPNKATYSQMSGSRIWIPLGNHYCVDHSKTVPWTDNHNATQSMQQQHLHKYCESIRQADFMQLWVQEAGNTCKRRSQMARWWWWTGNSHWKRCRGHL